VKTRKRWPKGTWMRLRSPDTLRALMGQYDFSLDRLARYAGCHKSFISHLLSGRRSSCTPELADRLAEALNIPTMVLFEPRMSTNSTTADSDRETAA
jgi:transcriptional regulator with XRE-family HTH domain